MVNVAADKMDGIIVNESCAELLVRGEKTMVIKTEDINFRGEELLLVSKGKLWGTLVLGESTVLKGKNFDEHFGAHHITDAARKEMWPEMGTLFGFDVVKVNPLKEPRDIRGKEYLSKTVSTDTPSDNENTSKVVTLYKTDDPEDQRIAFGVVLEPEVVDGQGDIYDADVIKGAAHGFMENFQNMGLMHKEILNQEIRILESFLAHDDMVIGDRQIKKGTWLLKVRVLSNILWKNIREGKLVGFSIGGLATSVPVV